MMSTNIYTPDKRDKKAPKKCCCFSQKNTLSSIKLSMHGSWSSYAATEDGFFTN